MVDEGGIQRLPDGGRGCLVYGTVSGAVTSFWVVAIYYGFGRSQAEGGRCVELRYDADMSMPMLTLWEFLSARRRAWLACRVGVGCVLLVKIGCSIYAWYRIQCRRWGKSSV